MDIRLVRRPHPNRMVRGSGITPTDPYLEWCWLPVVGPSTVALVRHVADLTSDSCEARIPMADLSRLLGVGRVVDPSARNNKLVRTIVRAEQFGLGFTSLGVPEGATFGIHDHVALVPSDCSSGFRPSLGSGTWRLWRPPTRPLGPPACRLRSPLREAWQAPKGLEADAVAAASETSPMGAQPALLAVPPIARHAQASTSTPPPGLSL